MENEKEIFLKKSIYNILKFVGALLTVCGFASFFGLLREDVHQIEFKNVTAVSYWVSIFIGLLGFVIFYLSNKKYDISFRHPDDDYYSKKKLIIPVMIFTIIVIWFFYIRV